MLTQEEIEKFLNHFNVKELNKIKDYLDLGYYKPGKNRVYLNKLNEEEKKGNFWYRKDFFFWEVNCDPVYNKSIETFGVPFIPLYNTEEDKIETIE